MKYYGLVPNILEDNSGREKAQSVKPFIKSAPAGGHQYSEFSGKLLVSRDG